MSTHIPASLLSPSRMKLNVVELSERDADSDFKTLVLGKLEDTLKDIQVLGSNVLVATYVRPRKTVGGIILPDNSVHEDRYQGKAGLVLKVGASAFKWDGGYAYEGPVPRVGDYVVFHSSDTREIGLCGFSCRFVDSSLIRMTVASPDSLY